MVIKESAPTGQVVGATVVHVLITSPSKKTIINIISCAFIESYNSKLFHSEKLKNQMHLGLVIPFT